jgi:amidase
MEGHETVPSVIGPMARNIVDARFLFNLLVGMQSWLVDPTVLNMPLQIAEHNLVAEKVRSRTLSFGILRSDGVVKPHPPIQRALDHTVQKLRAVGYEVSSSLNKCFIPPADLDMPADADLCL